MNFHRRTLILGTALLVACPGLPVAAQGTSSTATTALPTGNELVRVTVTAIGRHNNAAPPVSREDVLVFQDRDRREVVDWKPLRNSPAPTGVDLALLVDDSLDTTLGVQLADLTEFVRSLPATVRLGIFYASNGTFRAGQDFTSDHEVAVKALRLPLSRIAAFSSIYLSLDDLLKRWPETENRREVLLISDGIDLFRGVASSSPGINPDLEQTIRQAQRSNVIVYTLYASGGSRFRRNFFLVGNGQGCLARLAYETGGESFFQGLQTPVAFKPFLEELEKMLGQQYLLTFKAQLGKKAGYERLRVTTELPGVELVAPEHVYIRAVEQ